MKQRTNLSYQALKKSSFKRKQELPQAKKDSKQHGSLMHSKSKTNQSIHKKMKCIFPIPMNNIYRKEQEVSRKGKNVKSNATNTNSLWMQKEYNNKKVSQKHTKIKIQSLEQGLPSTALEGSWQSGSGRASLLANDVQAVAQLMANKVHAVAPLLSNSTCSVGSSNITIFFLNGVIYSINPY